MKSNVASGLIPSHTPSADERHDVSVALHARGGRTHIADTPAKWPITSNSVRTLSRNGSTAANRGRKQIEIPDAAD
ncbi:hypothetical protein [Burkholderia anthina]|uniref:hypothetical protein n=1 Tax=Burkholderia anthina TaxID=179879 RepID=UPI00158E7C78|nr:hypothetical protein [Burkholderia anthina]